MSFTSTDLDSIRILNQPFKTRTDQNLNVVIHDLLKMVDAFGGSGTVTSVALALPSSVFTVTGSPVTSTGTLTGSLKTQNANKVFAGPSTGADAAPTFRALVADDMPDLSSLYWAIDGNTVGAEKKFGTVDNFDLPFITNNTEWMRILKTGEVGIGLTSATAKIHVKGAGATSASYAVKVENSSTTSLFSIRNDGLINLGLSGGAIGVGYDIGFVPSTSMVFFGQDIGNDTFSGGLNFAFGYSNFNALTSGSNNIAIGYTNLNSATTATACVAVGHTALVSNTTGSYNQAFGNNALNANTTGTSNTAIGYQAMYQNTTGDSCVAIGEQALFSQVNPTGRNVAVGVYAGRLTTGSNGLFLGTWAGRYETAGNSLYIDTLDRSDIANGKTKSLVYGIFDADPLNQQFHINAKVINLDDLPTGNVGVNSGELYVDTAANIFANGDLILARKV